MADLDESLLAARVTLPEHVVRRAFAEESIALNLDTGQYHGLNPIAAAMIDALETGSTGEEVVQRFAQEYDESTERIRGDLLRLLRDLTERGLVEIRDPGSL